eukprot:NODE_5704_length_917_cov_749.098237_g5481_i0.p1 GENE.NODE_5704_length_917_cov_749.098237_g5481_i0~~NODE_5704_length_917_cov_749.098237_g5481_i0.p1  ORF type:complete len:242 (-),score=59.99 NODE_5704_length_917_cov_749.098237_g5481_i0:88-813(-)
MGITRSGLHKKRVTGGKRHIHRKKRKYELGRPASMTKLVPGERRVRPVRVRGGHTKWRALRLDGGNFSWGSEGMARKSRILEVVYNAANGEFVRTKTLTKGTIVTIDTTPYRNWYFKYYGINLGKHVKLAKVPKRKKGMKKVAKKPESKAKKADDKKPQVKKRKWKIPKNRLRKWAERAKSRGEIDANVRNQFESGTGKILACISSRPGQVGRADGYILEGDELAFYMKKMEKKKKSKKAE